MTFRLEKDPLGEKQVPADALYGIQTLRAGENFPISGLRPPPAFAAAVLWLKRGEGPRPAPAPSHNMNCNEVLANRANELLAGARGAYTPVHPNDHVNMAQSTNDTIPTNIRLACLSQLAPLAAAFGALRDAFAEK